MESHKVLLRAFVRQHDLGMQTSDDEGLPFDMWMDRPYQAVLTRILDAAKDIGVEWGSLTPSDIPGLSGTLSSASGLDSDIVARIIGDMVSVLSIPDAEDYPGISIEDMGDRSFVHASDTDVEAVDIPFMVHVGDWLVRVSTISDYGFEGCTRLREVNIPEGPDSIEACAFKGCTSLEQIHIPSTVTDIRPYVFKGCKALRRVDVHPDNPRYHSVDGVVFRKDRHSLDLCPEGLSGGYRVPDVIRAIANSGFEGCSQIESISIPAGVTSIVSYAFDGCRNLTSISVDEDNMFFSSVDGVLFDKEGT